MLTANVTLSGRTPTVLKASPASTCQVDAGRCDTAGSLEIPSRSMATERVPISKSTVSL